MTPERKHQISALFHAAREMPAAQRTSFVAEACGGDKELRKKVEAMLEADVRAGDFLKQSLHAIAEKWSAAGSSPASASLADAYLPDSPLLGRYRILSRLGAGGMGEVFLAEDTQLDRRVAVKLLPAEFTTDLDRLRRFTREAKAASALNHPNIVTIHEIGQVKITGGSLHFIVTEYVHGQTLRERMDAGKMPLDAALDVAVQVAGALAAAHEAGIIHRDIKPENLIVRRDGYVKLLDFGLAKLTEEGARERKNESAGEELTKGEDAETPSRPPALSTEPGKVMGTAHYMSPEQARGLPIDVRTDIFSLGVVLYEMIAGHAPFEGVNAIEVMGSILNQEPAPLRPHLTALGSGALEVERIVAKALCKDLGERYQTIDDMRADLRKAKGDSDARAAVSSGKLSDGEFPRYKNRGAVLLAAILLAVAIGAAAYYGLDRSPTRATSQPSILPFSSLSGRESDPDFSPDGNQLAFAWDGGEGGQTDIFVKLVGPGTPLRLTSDPANESSPAWSPDGRSIAFIRSGQTGGTLLIIPALGGPERKIFTSNSIAGNINWSPDGKWLALSDRPDSNTAPRIVMVSVETGETRTLTNPPAGSFDLRPYFSPDGRQLAFVRDNGKVYLTSVTSGAGSGEKMLIANLGVITRLTWTADGREIIFDSNLVGNWNLWRVLPSGGTPEALLSERAVYGSPALARQGNRLAVVESRYDTDIRRLELPTNGVDIKSEAMTRLIHSQLEDDSPQYSPDGKKIAFASSRSGTMEVWVCSSDGSNPLQLTQTGTASAGSARWSPDSRQLVYDSNLETHGDVFMIDAEGGAPRRLTTETSSDVVPSWSRDGAWIYFCSDRSGSRQIWKMPSAGGPGVQVTQKGGFEAVEAPDGKTLYYSKGYIHGLWTIPSKGGQERQVPELAEAGYRRSWTMTNEGIYFVAHTASAPPRPLKFFNFATHRVMQLGMVEKDPLRWVPSLAISPDGRWLLYAQIEQNTSSIMLVENFR